MMESTRELYDASIRTAPSHELYWPIQMMLHELGFDWTECRRIHQDILKILQEEVDEQRAAEKIWVLIGSRQKTVSEKLAGRAELIAAQIKKHLRGQNILDFGCGDGSVGSIMTSYGFDVTPYDVADYRPLANKKQPLDQHWSTRTGAFDTAIVVTVFHHCNDPMLELARLRRVANRLVVIESVVDINMPFASQAAIDWLYNRGMHPGAAIPVPGKFKTIEGWRAAFAETGWKVVQEEDIGIDLPVVPEHHHLFVCERV